MKRRLMFAVALAWSLAWAWIALGRWRFQEICATFCPAYGDPLTNAWIARRSDWQTPLAVAALPLALAVLALLLRLARRRQPRA